MTVYFGQILQIPVEVIKEVVRGVPYEVVKEVEVQQPGSTPQKYILYLGGYMVIKYVDRPVEVRPARRDVFKSACFDVGCNPKSSCLGLTARALLIAVQVVKEVVKEVIVEKEVEKIVEVPVEKIVEVIKEVSRDASLRSTCQTTASQESQGDVSLQITRCRPQKSYKWIWKLDASANTSTRGHRVPVDRVVEVYVDRPVEVIKEVVKEVIKEVPREVIKEVIKEVPKEVIKEVRWSEKERETGIKWDASKNFRGDARTKSHRHKSANDETRALAFQARTQAVHMYSHMYVARCLPRLPIPIPYTHPVHPPTQTRAHTHLHVLTRTDNVTRVSRARTRALGAPVLRAQVIKEVQVPSKPIIETRDVVREVVKEVPVEVVRWKEVRARSCVACATLRNRQAFFSRFVRHPLCCECILQPQSHLEGMLACHVRACDRGPTCECDFCERETLHARVCKRVHTRRRKERAGVSGRVLAERLCVGPHTSLSVSTCACLNVAALRLVAQVPVDRVVEKIVKVPTDRIIEVPIEKFIKVPSTSHSLSVTSVQPSHNHHRHESPPKQPPKPPARQPLHTPTRAHDNESDSATGDDDDRACDNVDDTNADAKASKPTKRIVRKPATVTSAAASTTQVKAARNVTSSASTPAPPRALGSSARQQAASPRRDDDADDDDAIDKIINSALQADPLAMAPRGHARTAGGHKVYDKSTKNLRTDLFRGRFPARTAMPKGKASPQTAYAPSNSGDNLHISSSSYSNKEGSSYSNKEGSFKSASASSTSNLKRSGSGVAEAGDFLAYSADASGKSEDTSRYLTSEAPSLPSLFNNGTQNTSAKDFLTFLMPSGVDNSVYGPPP
eukprot:6195521-Pleurochrysis_carterae.AAC.8